MFDEVIESRPLGNKKTCVIRRSLSDVALVEVAKPDSGIDDITRKISHYQYNREIIKSLANDLFLLFYKIHPILEEDENIHPDYLRNKRMVEMVMAMPEFKTIRDVSVLNDAISLIAAMSVMDTILDYMITEVKDASRNGGNGMPGNHGGSSSPAKGRAIGDAVYGNLMSCSEGRKAIKKAMADIAPKLKGISSALSWGSELGIFSYGGASAIPLARVLLKNPMVLRIMEKIGRAMASSHGTGEIRVPRVSDIDMGNDLMRVLPSELMKIDDPVLEILFYRDFIERNLMQYNSSDDGAGDMVVCLDLSGSMTGEPEEWARAIALASLFVASSRGSNWTLVPFSTTVGEIIQFNSQRPPDAEGIEKVATVSMGGGTDFVPPLEKAMELTQRSGDILMITDGICELPSDFRQRFLEFKSHRKVRMFTVQIGDYYTDLRDLSDGFYILRPGDDNGMRDVTLEVIKELMGV